MTLGSNAHSKNEAWFLSRPLEQQLVHLDVALVESDDAIDLIVEAVGGDTQVIHCLPDETRKRLER